MRAIVATSTLIATTLLAGCKGGGGDEAGVSAKAFGPIEASEVIDWPYWPASLRIHPLTRLVKDDTGTVRSIEARIEFFDAHGHTTKACGLLYVDLHVEGDPVGGLPAARWPLDLGDETFNLERFDVVTRTYLFTLELEPDLQIPEAPELRVYYRTGRGEHLDAQQIGVRTE